MTSTVDILAAVVAAITLVGLFVWLGWQLALEHFRHVQSGLQQQRDLLDAEWQALDNTRRVREVFLLARRAMQREADQPRRGGQSS